MPMTKEIEGESLGDMLLQVEIDSKEWQQLKPMGKLGYLKKELKKLKAEKFVDVASRLASSFCDIVRANTSSPVVRSYLGLVDTAFGLVKSATVLDNMFVSRKHEIHSEFDELAEFMGIEGGGVTMITDSLEATSSICETFLKMPPATQKKYGLRFLRVSEKNEDEEKSDDSMIVTFVDAEMVSADFGKIHIGFEVGYYSSKHRNEKVSEESSYAYVNYGFWAGECDFTILDRIPSIIYGAYIDSVDISKNVIEIRGGMLYTKPRTVIDFDVRNFDLKGDDGKVVRTLESESEIIRKVLDRKGRRGYIIQGDQGTGKTISVNRLLMDFTDTPVFWISPDSVSDKNSMQEVFRILTMFPGSFFVFDDFDGNNFSTKNSLTSTFINSIDETLSPGFRGIVMLIINEPQKLHSTIKLRPGRIDDIIYVENPRTVDQVADVVTQRFVHMKLGVPEWVSRENPEFVEAAGRITSSNLTHAYITGIVNDMVELTPDDISCTRFTELIERKKASIRYARMVALDDGHIVDGGAPRVAEVTDDPPPDKTDDI